MKTFTKNGIIIGLFTFSTIPCYFLYMKYQESKEKNENEYLMTKLVDIERSLGDTIDLVQHNNLENSIVFGKILAKLDNNDESFRAYDIRINELEQKRDYSYMTTSGLN